MQDLLEYKKQGVKTCPNTYAVYVPVVYMHSATFGHNGVAMHIYSRYIHFTVLNACFNTRPGL